MKTKQDKTKIQKRKGSMALERRQLLGRNWILVSFSFGFLWTIIFSRERIESTVFEDISDGQRQRG